MRSATLNSEFRILNSAEILHSINCKTLWFTCAPEGHRVCSTITPGSSSTPEELRGKIKADEIEHVAPTEPGFLFSHICYKHDAPSERIMKMADSGR
jgi:hypothetical protein